MNTNLNLLEGPVQGPRSTRSQSTLSPNRTNHAANRDLLLNGHASVIPEIPTLTPPPAPVPAVAQKREVELKRSPGFRIVLFRAVRLAAGSGIICAAAVYLRSSFSSATSEQGYINAELTVLRAPISGQVHFENIAPGRSLAAGTQLFRIDNVRFGNQESASHADWATELAERLKLESEEALIRVRQQEQVFELHAKLHAEKLISRLELLEEESKLELARTLATNKQALAVKAASRVEEIKRQLDLQKSATVAMPFAGAAWSVRPRDGAEVSAHETIAEVIDPQRIRVDAFFHERHAGKLAVGTRVQIRNIDSAAECGGTVEWVRGGVGRIPFEESAAVAPGDYTRRRIAVRIKPDAGCTLDAGEFFGVGRSVIVTVQCHEQ